MGGEAREKRQEGGGGGEEESGKSSVFIRIANCNKSVILTTM